MNGDLTDEWASSQVEAWVDGSLDAAQRARMRPALAQSSELRAAVQRATALRRALRGLPRARLPLGLRARLLAIAGSERPARPRLLAPLAAAVGTVAVFVAAAWLLAPAPQPPEAAAAIRDFELAMQYVRKSARIAQEHVAANVGTGLLEALAASRASLDRNSDETGG